MPHPIVDFDPLMCRPDAERFRETLDRAVHGPDGPVLNFITSEQLYRADTRLFAARHGSTTIAIARLDFAQRNDAMLTSVYVCEAYRKGGVGQAIVSAVIGHANNLDLPRIKLTLRILDIDQLPPAQRLYERCGFILQCGVECRKLGDDEDERHLWGSCDDGGTIRTRAMVLDLRVAQGASRDAA